VVNGKDCPLTESHSAEHLVPRDHALDGHTPLPFRMELVHLRRPERNLARSFHRRRR
jgi:hypothetical protein